MGRNLEAFILENYKKAIDYHEIQPFYQPVIRTASRRLCSFEALARWMDPDLGMIYPDEFIPVLEKHGLIHLLDTAILRQVCARIRSAIASGETPIPVSVNLSRLDFTLCDIFDVCDDIVSDYQIPHGFVYFEITESVMAEEKELMLGIVDRFRAAGYQIWMDDFGSAYSSLNVLKEFAFDELKLDMSFLRPFNLRSKRIVTAVVKMAKVIDIHTLAEGVETEEQFAYLRDIGCEKAQGYYFGRPLAYEQALANLRDKGIEIEVPQDRHYYDEIGKIDYLSAVPFMTRGEYDANGSARLLNSIPLALAEFFEDRFRVLFYNAAFEETTYSAGMFTGVFTQENLCRSQPNHRLTRNILNLMDSVKVNGDGRMIATVHEQYFEIMARRMAQTEGKYCVLIRITNLTKDTQAEQTGYLDASIRQIYSLYERITLINYPQDTIRPLYTDTREDLLSNRQGIRQLVEEYARRYVYPEDKDRFIQALDPTLVTTRLKESGNHSFSQVFRSSVRHGQYAWKEYTLLRIDQENYLLLVRNVHDAAKGVLSENAAGLPQGGPFGGEQLWDNLIHSQVLRIFWKDRDRRFLGVSQAFLDFYDFASAEEVVGRTDEELGWHVHPDLYMNDEYKVIHEGVSFLNVPGNCMSHGENVNILASKGPLYDSNGEIVGLLGYFVDNASLGFTDEEGRESSRRDLLTGLLNSRGISEEAETFRDEYYLRGTDFVRIHIGINDFDNINRQYGFDFGDKVLKGFARALQRGFGVKCAIGRYAGRKFTVLQQAESQEEARQLRKKVKAIGDSLREIDGESITLYLSVGYARFSEYQDLEEMTKNAEVRLHADYDQNISAESRIDHALELFSLFDDLPVPYSVFHITHSERSGRYNAVFFYVNHKYEEFANLPAKAMLGHTVREVFPFLGEDWHQDVKRAALDGEAVEGEFDVPVTGKRYHFTVRQIIYPGYCAITSLEIPAGKQRKSILLVGDEEQGPLGEMLAQEYGVYPTDLDNAMQEYRLHRNEIALLLLDLPQPRQALVRLRVEEGAKQMPVVVLSDDHAAELDCLTLGALDFIPKPCPNPEVVLARLARCIDLWAARESGGQ